MRIWAVAILLAFLMPIVAVTTASAHETGEHPDRGKGTVSFSQGAIISGPTVLNPHTTIQKVKETLSFTGNMTGTAQTIERDVMHTHTDDGTTITFTTFHGSGNFTGTINSVQVTLHIRYEGWKNSTFTKGNFVVNGDTSQMNDVHGEGHFRGSGGPPIEGTGTPGGVNYTMHWHISTHTEQPETKDKD